jgi:hypothetical protein
MKIIMLSSVAVVQLEKNVIEPFDELKSANDVR